MKELIKKLGDKANEIAKLMLADVVEDVDLLTVALSASGLREIAYTIAASQKGEVRYTAAHQALDIGWSINLREKLQKEAYLAKGVSGLLELARNNADVGSRLMPVFEEVLSQHKDFDIPKKLCSENKNYMNEKKNADGFAITQITDEGKVVVKPAAWVTDALFND